jgi:hypothetical protein
VLLGTLLGQMVCPDTGVSLCPAPEVPVCLPLIFPQSFPVSDVQTYCSKSKGVSGL